MRINLVLSKEESGLNKIFHFAMRILNHNHWSESPATLSRGWCANKR